MAHDSTDWLSSVDIPTLVIGGKHDLLFPPSMTELLANSVADGRSVLLDCAHLPPVEAAREFNQEIIKFADDIAA